MTSRYPADWDDWGIKLLLNPIGSFRAGLLCVFGESRILFMAGFCDRCAQGGLGGEGLLNETIRAA